MYLTSLAATCIDSLFVLAYSLDFGSDIIDGLNVLECYPNLILLPLDFCWLEFSLFYIYVQKISIFPSNKISYWVLYPGIASIFVNVILFFLPLPTKIFVANSFGYFIYILGGAFFSLCIGFLTIIWINKHIKEIKNQFASIEYKELGWARLFVEILLISDHGKMVQF